MSDTFGGVPVSKLIEMPVAEEMQTGMAIGMSLQGIFLANLRLAPVQVSSWGHPASSRSGGRAARPPRAIDPVRSGPV